MVPVKKAQVLKVISPVRYNYITREHRYVDLSETSSYRVSLHTLESDKNIWKMILHTMIFC